jgi:hypothetical protein
VIEGDPSRIDTWMEDTQMLTIIDCGISQGYSREDHLNSNGPARGAIGRNARTLAEALRIVARAAKTGNATRSPVWVRCRNEFGDIIES